MENPMTPAPLARALLAVLLAWPLAAAAQQDDLAAAKKELDAARDDLQRAATRVAELSRATGAARPLAFDLGVMRKPRLGVLLAADDGAGVRITGVTPDSGAAKAGLKAGDRLLRIAGTPIAGDSGELRLGRALAAVADLKADTPVALVFQRDGREREVQVTPAPVAPRIASGTADGPAAFTFIRRGEGAPRLEGVPLPLDELRHVISPEVQRELGRLGTLTHCEDGDCKLPALAEAFRWNSLNLASVDAQLGRYFGTGKGVLVLSADTLEGLQAGDVILSLEGKPVATPREVVDALRGRPEDAKVSVEYLRDRQPRTATLAVPRATPLRLPLPARIARPARPAGTPGDAPQVVRKHRVMLIDADGNVRTYGDDADDASPPSPPSPPTPPAPAAGKGSAVL